MTARAIPGAGSEPVVSAAAATDCRLTAPWALAKAEEILAWLPDLNAHQKLDLIAAALEIAYVQGRIDQTDVAKTIGMQAFDIVDGSPAPEAVS